MGLETITSGHAGESKGALARYNFKAKAVKHLDVLERNLKVIKEAPVSVVIHPTNACNAKCPMCRYADLRETSETIPLDVMKQTVTELGKMGTKSIIFSGGGEPTIYQGLAEVIELAASYDIKTGLVTNLIRLSPKLMNAIVDNMSWARISINAASAEAYQIVQGMDPAVWPKLLDNIKRVVEARNQKGTKLAIGGSFIVQKGNYRESGDFLDLCADLGVDYAIYRPVQKWSPTAALMAGSLALTKEMIEELRSIATEKLRTDSVKFCDNNLSKAADLFTAVDAAKTYPKCLSSKVESAIGGDGSVYPCCQHVGNTKFASGNILQRSFWDIWTSPEARTINESVEPNLCPPCRYDFYNRVFNEYEKGWRPTQEEITKAAQTPDVDFM
ncbi:MAG: radical SAM protein [Thaumarchaeota archaeon]|nr:radical SAM protein [Nitrososphaerota archaeon]